MAQEVGSQRHAEVLKECLTAWTDSLPSVDWGLVKPLLAQTVRRGFEFANDTLAVERRLDEHGRIGFLRHPTKVLSLLSYAVGFEMPADAVCARCASGQTSLPFDRCVVAVLPSASLGARTARASPRKRKKSGLRASAGVVEVPQVHGQRLVQPAHPAYSDAVEQLALFQGACACCAWNGKEHLCSFHPEYVAPARTPVRPAAQTLLNNDGLRATFLARMGTLGVGVEAVTGLIESGLGRRAEEARAVKRLRTEGRAAKKAKGKSKS